MINGDFENKVNNVINSDLMKSYIQELLQSDVQVQKAIKITKDNDEITRDFVDKTLLELENLIYDEDNKFNVKNGFQALAKCIVYLNEQLFDSYKDFQNELSIAHKLTVESIRQLKFSQDFENVSFSTLMLIAGSLIDYVFFREALGKYINS